jgi:nitroreductase
LLEAIKARRSIRQFRDEPVDVHTVEAIVEVVNWSPTSCNRQPAKVFATNSPSLARSCLATCQGATGFSEFVPCFLSFCADPRSYWLPRELELPLMDVSLGVQNCCLMAHSQGLSLTLLSWANHTDDDERVLRDLLAIPDHFKIVVNGALGYPEHDVPVPLRKPIESTLVLR